MDIGIIGLGLMGGSIVKKLRKCNEIKRIIAYDTNVEDLKIAKEENFIDDYSLSIDDKFSNLDYIFICVPVKYTTTIAKELEKHVTNNCLVIDIGSTKGTIVPILENMKFKYIGTHPMVGKETSGFKYSDSHLYEKSYFLITTTSKTSEESIQKVTKIIEILEGIPYIIPLEKHDFIVSAISHVPHIVAFSLVNMAKDLDDNNAHLKTLAAGGFKDITRIASSSPQMWKSIFLENKSEILKTLDTFKNSLNYLEECIVNMDENGIDSFIQSSKNYRDSIDNLKKNNEINVKIVNTPGELEKIISILAKHNINIINLSIQDDIDEKQGTLKLFFSNIDMKEYAENILKENNVL